MSVSTSAIDDLAPLDGAALYDCSARLFTSDRMYRAPLDGGHVLFNPDWRGLPVVVADWVADTVDAFRGGAVVGDVLATLPASVDLGDGLDAIEYLEGAGFLRPRPTPRRYTAGDFGAVSSRSLGIWLHVNNHCNLDCAYCFVDKFKSTMNPETVTRTVDHLVHTITTRGITEVLLKFAGGEPTLSVATMEEFYDRLATALKPLPHVRLRIGVLTNGTILHARLLQFYRRTRATVAISLDGYGEDSHDIYRVFTRSRKGSWAIIQRNIEELKQEGIPVSINATISAQSCRTLPALVRWIASNGFASRLSVVRQPDASWAGGRREADYERLTTAVSAAFGAAFEELEKPEYDLDLRRLSLCELHFDEPITTACCGIATNHLVIQDDGQLASCPMTTRENPVPAGADLVETARLTFLHSPAMRNDDTEKNCLDCRWFPVCTSGCPVTNLRIKGKAFTISPLHAFYDYVIPRYIEFFGRKLLQSAARRGIEAFAILRHESDGFLPDEASS